MKKLIVCLLLLPLISFSQISSWRGGGRVSPSISPSTSIGRTFSQPQYNQPPRNNGVSSWRTQPPKTQPKPGQYYGTPYIYDPYWDWGWNRWYSWGAPYGYNNYYPYTYYDNWGYRQPARIYVDDSGKRDTIIGKKTQFSFGVQTSTGKQIGSWITIGNKGYFIAEFNTTYEKDRSTFFPNGQRQDVDFPLVNDYVRTRTFYVGVGKRVHRTGFHVMLGNANERVRWRGYDNIGYITFPKYIDNSLTVKIGAIHDFKTSSVKLDFDPMLNKFTFGVGVNF